MEPPYPEAAHLQVPESCCLHGLLVEFPGRGWKRKKLPYQFDQATSPSRSTLSTQNGRLSPRCLSGDGLSHHCPPREPFAWRWQGHVKSVLYRFALPLALSQLGDRNSALEVFVVRFRIKLGSVSVCNALQRQTHKCPCASTASGGEEIPERPGTCAKTLSPSR